MDNMMIYERARSVPEEATKPFSNGRFSGTDINPMWRIKTLTELFGPCGVGWYYEVVSERAEEHHDTTMAIVDLKLYIKVDGEWSKPIYGTGGNALVKTTKGGKQASDEGYKMALTDALSVACKALGIGADVYWDKDKTKYTQPEDEPRGGTQRQPAKTKDKPVPDSVPETMAFKCGKCGKALRPYKNPNTGEQVGVRQHAALTNKLYGMTLCRECAAAEAAERRKQERIDGAAEAMLDGMAAR